MTTSEETLYYLTPSTGAGHLIRHGQGGSGLVKYSFGSDVRPGPHMRAYSSRQVALVNAVAGLIPALPFRIYFSTTDTAIIVAVKGSGQDADDQYLAAEQILTACSLGIADYPGSGGLGATCTSFGIAPGTSTHVFTLKPPGRGAINPALEQLMSLVPQMNVLLHNQGTTMSNGTAFALNVCNAMALAYLAGAGARDVCITPAR
jgi:hypothetical protein